MEKPTIEQFQLTKFKTKPNGSVIASYTINLGDALVERTDICGRLPHPDLKRVFEDATAVVSDILGIEGADKFEVRGLALSGSGDNAAVIITSVYTTPNGMKTAINTPRIKFSGEEYDTLRAFVDKAIAESYAYLFEGKEAQLSIFGEEPESAFND